MYIPKIGIISTSAYFRNEQPKWVVIFEHGVTIFMGCFNLRVNQEYYELGDILIYHTIHNILC